MNTVLTESVMEATELPRAVASSTYSGIRFVGGAIAPALAGVLAAALSPAAPYVVGAVALLVAVGVLLLGRRHLAHLDKHAADQDEHETITEQAVVLTAADS